MCFTDDGFQRTIIQFLALFNVLAAQQDSHQPLTDIMGTPGCQLVKKRGKYQYPQVETIRTLPILIKRHVAIGSAISFTVKGSIVIIQGSDRTIAHTTSLWNRTITGDLIGEG